MYDLSEPAEISLLSDVGVLEMWIKLHYHYPDKIVSLMRYLAALSVQKSIDIKEASGPVVGTWEIKWNLSNQHLR